MKPILHGNKYRITYRCKNYPDLIHESFDTEEEANLRIAQIRLERKRGTLLPPPERVRCPVMCIVSMTISFRISVKFQLRH